MVLYIRIQQDIVNKQKKQQQKTNRQRQHDRPPLFDLHQLQVWEGTKGVVGNVGELRPFLEVTGRGRKGRRKRSWLEEDEVSSSQTSFYDRGVLFHRLILTTKQFLCPNRKPRRGNCKHLWRKMIAHSDTPPKYFQLGRFLLGKCNPGISSVNFSFIAMRVRKNSFEARAVCD